MTVEFAWWWALAALPLPWLFSRLPVKHQTAAKPTLELPFQDALSAVQAPGKTLLAQRSRIALAVLVWLLLILAASRPQLIGTALELPVSGRDLMLAVDLSGSMQAEDMRINRRPRSRLNVVKAVAGEFIERRQGDRIGLILFGDQAYLQTPLTFDTDTVHTQLSEAVIGLAGKRTAIGDAIGLATKRLRQQGQDNKVLILLTDGTNTTGQLEPLKAAELAARHQIRIYTIGIGSNRTNRRAAGGELDEATLTAIAKATDGHYFRARDVAELEQIYQLIDTIEPVDKDTHSFKPVHEIYRWPLAMAVFISLGMVVTRLPWPFRHTTSGIKHA